MLWKRMLVTSRGASTKSYSNPADHYSCMWSFSVHWLRRRICLPFGLTRCVRCCSGGSPRAIAGLPWLEFLTTIKVSCESRVMCGDLCWWRAFSCRCSRRTPYYSNQPLTPHTTLTRRAALSPIAAGSTKVLGAVFSVRLSLRCFSSLPSMSEGRRGKYSC